MARFLFTVAPFAGHVHRMLPDAEALVERGHDVAWVAHSALVGHLLPSGQPVFDLPSEPARAAVQAHRASALAAPFGPSVAIAAMDEVALPLARSTLGDIDRAVDVFAPHCLVSDVAAVAGGLVARRRGLRWASSAQPATLAQRELYETEVIREFARSRLDPLQAEAGLDPVDWPNWSPYLILVNAVPELVGDVRLPRTVRLVGATFDRPRPPVAFPWHLLDDRPTVFVSLGTVAEHLGRRFLDAVARALADEPLQAVVATAPELLPDPPANFLVRPFVPQIDLLRRVDAVVSHGGMNTVVEALAHGRPLVVAPIAYDQPFNASRVAAIGAGIRVRFARPRVEEVRHGVQRVLAEPSYREHATRVGAALRAAGGAAAAADALEELVAAHRPVARAGPA